MKTLQEQLRGLDVMTSAVLGGLTVQLQPIPGEVEVVQVSVGQREAFPVYVTASDAQILCMCYLWAEDEIRPERRTEMLETLLDLNPSVPLSSFGRVGNHYVLFGALARDARVEDVAKDVAALSDNAFDALDAMAEFLK
jgi:uncharacterized protein